MPARLTIADAAVALHADWAAFQREVAKDGTAQAKTAGQKITAALGPTGITKAFTAAGAAGGALFVGAIGGAVNFEDQLRTINTVAHLTDGELKSVGDSILGLSKETGKSTTDLTAGFYDLVSAGVPAKDAINVLRDSAKFATGALGTTGEAVDLVTSALNAYGLKAGDSTRITDIFAQAVADGKVTAAELGASIANIAPIAASAGISLEEVSAGYALLTAKGVPAAQAATEMRAAISALLTPNAQLNAIQQQTGINFAKLAREKGLAVALEELRKATEGNASALDKLATVSEQDFPAALKAASGALGLTTSDVEKFTAIAGKDGAAAALQQLATQVGVSDSGFAKALGSIEGYQYALTTTGANAGAAATELDKVKTAAEKGGVAEGQYTEQMKSAKKQGEVWLANLQALAIQIGGPFVGVLGPTVSVLGSFGQGLFGIFRLSQLVGGGIGALVGRLVGLGASSAASAVGIGATGVAATAAAPGVGLLGAAVNFLLSPLGLILIAVGALGIAWATNFLGIRDIVSTVVGFVADKLGFLLGPISAVAGAVGGLLGFLGDVVHNAGTALGLIGDDATAAADKVDAAAQRVSDAMVAAGKTPAALADDLRESKHLIGQAAQAAIAEPIEAAVGTIPGHIAALGPEARKAASQAMLDLAGGLRQRRSDIDSAMAQLTDDIKNRMSSTAERAKLLGLLAGKKLSDGLRSSDPVVRAQAAATRQIIIDRLSELSANTHNVGKKGMESLRAAMRSKDPEIRAAATAIYNAATGKLGKIPAAGTKSGKDTATNVASQLDAGKGKVGAAAERLAIRVAQAIFARITHDGHAIANAGTGLVAYAAGSPYIPYDQVALVHKGERVLTAEQNAAVSSGQAVLSRGSGAADDSGGDTYIFDVDMESVPLARNPIDVARQLARFAQQGAFRPVAAVRR